MGFRWYVPTRVRARTEPGARPRPPVLIQPARPAPPIGSRGALPRGALPTVATVDLPLGASAAAVAVSASSAVLRYCGDQQPDNRSQFICSKFSLPSRCSFLRCSFIVPSPSVTMVHTQHSGELCGACSLLALGIHISRPCQMHLAIAPCALLLSIFCKVRRPDDFGWEFGNVFGGMRARVSPAQRGHASPDRGRGALP